MRRQLIVLTFVLIFAALLAACAAGQDARSADEVHAAWVEALRANDRQAAQTLVASDATLDLDWALTQAQYLVTLDSPLMGRLVAVDVETPEPRGAGQVGRSIWRMERLTSCFHTTLAQTSAGWRVTGWEERRTGCPETKWEGQE